MTLRKPRRAAVGMDRGGASSCWQTVFGQRRLLDVEWLRACSVRRSSHRSSLQDARPRLACRRPRLPFNASVEGRSANRTRSASWSFGPRRAISAHHVALEAARPAAPQRARRALTEVACHFRTVLGESAPTRPRLRRSGMRSSFLDCKRSARTPTTPPARALDACDIDQVQHNWGLDAFSTPTGELQPLVYTLKLLLHYSDSAMYSFVWATSH